MKRSCPFEPPHPKRVHLVQKHGTKRKSIFKDQICKRSRHDEMESLQNLLKEAYAKIHQLETELKQLKMIQFTCNEKMNLPYNHNVVCY